MHFIFGVKLLPAVPAPSPPHDPSKMHTQMLHELVNYNCSMHFIFGVKLLPAVPGPSPLHHASKMHTQMLHEIVNYTYRLAIASCILSNCINHFIFGVALLLAALPVHLQRWQYSA